MNLSTHPNGAPGSGSRSGGGGPTSEQNGFRLGLVGVAELVAQPLKLSRIAAHKVNPAAGLVQRVSGIAKPLCNGLGLSRRQQLPVGEVASQGVRYRQESLQGGHTRHAVPLTAFPSLSPNSRMPTPPTPSMSLSQPLASIPARGLTAHASAGAMAAAKTGLAKLKTRRRPCRNII